MDSRLAQVREFVDADGRLVALGVALALAILTFDIVEPLGVAAGVPYVVLVLLCLWAQYPVSTYLMAAIGTTLTVIGYFVSPEGGVEWVVLTNRALAILAIWALALLSAKRLAEIHRRQSAETKRHASEKRLSEILDLSTDAIISVDRQGHIEFFNSGAENIFGYGSEEVIGRPLDILRH